MTQPAPRTRRCLAALTLAAVLAAGCGRTPAAPTAPTATGQPHPAAATAGDRFGFALFQALRREKPKENLFFSPASVSLALAMTANGARGETLTAMQRTLATDDLTLQAINESAAALLHQAQPDPKVELTNANAIWYMQGFKVQPDFAQAMQTYYGATLAPAKFGSPSAAEAINQWVASTTRNTIPEIVEETKKDWRMALVNAIYFKGRWQEPFPPENTRPGTFTRLDGTTKQPLMMGQGGHYQYLKGENFQAVALPYGDGGRVQMYLFLPDPGVNPTDFFAGVTAERWQQWLGGFAPRQGSVLIPKVKLEYKADLEKVLPEMGMALAFDPTRADFSGLLQTTEPLYIGAVKHRTFLAIDEDGTEASAATIVEAKAGSARPSDPFSFIADHPFLVAIRDETTGTLLFLGAILEP
ncbi:MAG TPA: serpin family protein [Symbiobacteriaceae bacterium]|jgi:serpin B|nr:serpin family protein [Symbiobacteriaceae bacterium]